MKIAILLSFVLNIYCEDIYDFIIVGSGPAGAVLANRLSANPELRVLLLEAGERANLLTEVPALYANLEKTSYDWNDTISFPDEYHMPDINKSSPSHLSQGKALGGSSIINSMLYVRGNKKDFDNWWLKGACGWSWREVLPFFLKSENNLNPELAKTEYHGTTGELFVQYPTYNSKMKKIYIQAVRELGFRFGDVNGARQTVFTVPQITIKDGRRWSVEKAFLNPIIGRRNLKIITSAFVTKVIIGAENIAKGVEYVYKNRKESAFVKEEVILSAGAIRSPQLLMLSGIGPAPDLWDLGITVFAALPVGENLQDHPLVSLPIFEIASIKPIETLNISNVDLVEYFKYGNGSLSSVPIELLGFFSSIYNDDPEWPDSEIILLTVPHSVFAPGYQRKAMVYCANLYLKPRSRGRVKLKDSNPNTPPIIEGGYLKDKYDMLALAEGLEMCRKLTEGKALLEFGYAHLIPPQNFPTCHKYPDYKSKAYYRCIVMNAVKPSYHLVGTCKMGDPKDSTTVVDYDLKVKGIKGLRVADNSIAPEIITGHTYALAVMIGEKAADLILRDYYAKMGSPELLQHEL